MVLCILKLQSVINNGENVFCSWERTDLIHISNITFYYNRFSTSNASLRRMGRFRIQLLRNGSWERFLYNRKKYRFSEL